MKPPGRIRAAGLRIVIPRGHECPPYEKLSSVSPLRIKVRTGLGATQMVPLLPCPGLWHTATLASPQRASTTGRVTAASAGQPFAQT